MVMDMKRQMDRSGAAPAPLSLQSARPEHPQESHLPTRKEDVKPSPPPGSLLCSSSQGSCTACLLHRRKMY